jgi:hypothetical protein
VNVETGAQHSTARIKIYAVMIEGNPMLESQELAVVISSHNHRIKIFGANPLLKEKYHTKEFLLIQLTSNGCENL